MSLLLSQNNVTGATGLGVGEGTASSGVSRAVAAVGIAMALGSATISVTRAVQANGVGIGEGTAAQQVARAVQANGVGIGFGTAVESDLRSVSALGVGGSYGSASIKVSRAVQATGLGLGVGDAASSVARAVSANGIGIGEGTASQQVARAVQATALGVGLGIVVEAGNLPVTARGIGIGLGYASSTVYSGGFNVAGTGIGISFGMASATVIPTPPQPPVPPPQPRRGGGGGGGGLASWFYRPVKKVEYAEPETKIPEIIGRLPPENSGLALPDQRQEMSAALEFLRAHITRLGDGKLYVIPEAGGEWVPVDEWVRRGSYKQTIPSGQAVTKASPAVDLQQQILDSVQRLHGPLQTIQPIQEQIQAQSAVQTQQFQQLNAAVRATSLQTALWVLLGLTVVGGIGWYVYTHMEKPVRNPKKRRRRQR